MVRIRRYGGFKIPDGYYSDVQRIWLVMNKYFDHYTMMDAYRDWDEYSDSLCAGWIMLPIEDEEILEVLTIEDS